MIFSYIKWNVNPEIFSVPDNIWLVGGLSVRWYGLMFAASFFFGYIIMSKMFKREGIDSKLLDKLTIYMAVGTILGARLGHCLFYGPHFDTVGPNGEILVRGYLSHPLDMLKVWEGGLASHGAAIGILLSLYLFIRKAKKTYLWILDRIVIVVALSGLFIRGGNLMNSEIVGNPTEMSWGFIFVKNGEQFARHPAQLYEALSYLIIFFVLYYLYLKKDAGKKQGYIFSLFLIFLFSVRFLIEFVKDVQVDFEQSMALNMGQILSIPFVIIGIILLIFSIKRSKKEA